jgi:hypothetical protein
MNLRLPAAALAATLTALPAPAQESMLVPRTDVPAEQRITMDVLSRIYGDLEDLIGEGKPMSPGSMLRVMLVAKQKAAAETCEGFTVDPARYEKVMTEALKGVSASVAGEASDEMFQRVMLAFATGFGAELAFASLNPEGYCAFAAELREELAEDAEGLALVWADAP